MPSAVTGSSVEPPIPAVDREWSATQSDIATGASKLDLYIDVDERPEGIVGPVTYNPDVFEADAIRRLIQHWRTCLEGAAANPNQAVSKLPLLTAGEWRQILVDWNRTRADYPRNATIHQFFDAQAARTPEGLAVREGHTCHSFRELRERSNRLARFLQKMGAGRGTRVALCVERSLEMAVALLGILKTGAADVPLDPSHPADRMQFMLEDAETTLLVTQSRVLNRFPFSQAKTVTLDTDWQRIAQESASDLSTRVEPGDPAYVLYTSGSSGQPKGVEGTHGGAINRMWWMWERYPFQAEEVCCQKTNLGFVDSVWEIFGPLLAGVPSVILPAEVVRDPEELLRSLAGAGVTRMVVVPSLLRALLDHAPQLQERVPQLKLWTCSGEVLSGELVRRFRQGFAEARLLNIYGASEVAADVTWHEVVEEDIGGAGTDRQADQQHAGVRVGPAWESGTGGGTGRDLCGGRGAGARVLESSGADEGTICGKRDRAGGVETAVPDGGPGAVAKGWGDRVSGASGRGSETAGDAD
jgi:non-ribosomal peptide synthetase component F